MSIEKSNEVVLSKEEQADKYIEMYGDWYKGLNPPLEFTEQNQYEMRQEFLKMSKPARYSALTGIQTHLIIRNVARRCN